MCWIFLQGEAEKQQHRKQRDQTFRATKSMPEGGRDALAGHSTSGFVPLCMVFAKTIRMCQNGSMYGGAGKKFRQEIQQQQQQQQQPGCFMFHSIIIISSWLSSVSLQTIDKQPK
jgi:hypothetical protein